MTVRLDTTAEDRIRRTFTRQSLMGTLGATLSTITTEYVEFRVPFSAAFAQQHGYLHVGVVSSIVDTANGLAALSLFPDGAAFLAVEFKVNFIAPAKGDTSSRAGASSSPAAR